MIIGSQFVFSNGLADADIQNNQAECCAAQRKGKRQSGLASRVAIQTAL
jgi:hypothetical protein